MSHKPEILGALRGASGPMTSTEVAEAIEQHPTAVGRELYALAREGEIEQVEVDGKPAFIAASGAAPKKRESTKSRTTKAPATRKSTVAKKRAYTRRPRADLQPDMVIQALAEALPVDVPRVQPGALPGGPAQRLHRTAVSRLLRFQRRQSLVRRVRHRGCDMKAARFDFEGELLTVAEIRERVPALSDPTIRKHLEAGRNTRQAMLTYRPQWAKPTDAVRFPAKTGMAVSRDRTRAKESK